MLEEIQSDLTEVESAIVDLSRYVGDATCCENLDDLIANLTEAVKTANEVKQTIGLVLAMAKKKAKKPPQ